MNATQVQVEIFLSYDSDDNKDFGFFVNKWRKQMQKDLDFKFGTFKKGSRKIGRVRIYDYLDDSYTLGDDWPERQHAAIESCDVFVAFASTRYLSTDEDKETYREVHQALDLGKRIVVVWVNEPVERFVDKKHLAALKRIDAVRNLPKVESMSDKQRKDIPADLLKKLRDVVDIHLAQKLQQTDQSTLQRGRHPLERAVLAEYRRLGVSADSNREDRLGQILAGYPETPGSGTASLDTSVAELIELIETDTPTPAISDWLTYSRPFG